MYGQGDGIELNSMKTRLTEGGSSLPSPAAYKLDRNRNVNRNVNIGNLTAHIDPTSSKYDDEDYDPESDDIYLKNIPAWTARELLVATVAGGSVLSASLALIVASVNPIILVTGVLGIILPPYSALQEQKITDCKALRQTNMVMEQEMDNLKYNNQRLSQENEKLHTAVERLKDIKDAYAHCQGMKKVSTAALEKQLKMSQMTLKQMTNNHMNEVVQNIIDVMLAVDMNGDITLSDEEIDTLTKRIEGIHNVEIHDVAFKQKIIDNGRDVFAIGTLVQELMDDDPSTAPEDDVKIIRFLDPVT